MSIVCSTDEPLNVVIEDFIKDGHKYYGKVLNGHGNLYVQSCIMEKTHMDENDILLRFKNNKDNRGCKEFYKLLNKIETDVCNIFKESELNTSGKEYISIKKNMFRTCILPSKVLGEAPMMVANFPLIDEVEIYDKRGNPIDEQKLDKCNEVVVILKCGSIELCDNNLRLNWEVQQIAGIKRKKKTKVDKTFKIRKDN